METAHSRSGTSLAEKGCGYGGGGFVAPGRAAPAQRAPSIALRHQYTGVAESFGTGPPLTAKPSPGNFLRIGGGGNGGDPRPAPARDRSRELRPKAWASLGEQAISTRPSSPGYSLASRGIFGDPMRDPQFADALHSPSPAAYVPQSGAAQAQQIRSDRPSSPQASLHRALPDAAFFYSNSGHNHTVGAADYWAVEPGGTPHGLSSIGAQAISARPSSPAASLASRGNFGDPFWTDTARHGVGPGGVNPARAARPDLRTAPVIGMPRGPRTQFHRQRGYLGAGRYVPGPGRYRRDECDVGSRMRKGDGGAGGRAVGRKKASPAYSLGTRKDWERKPRTADAAGPGRCRRGFADRPHSPSYSFGLKPKLRVESTPGPGSYG